MVVRKKASASKSAAGSAPRAKPTAARLTLADVMTLLETSGSAQTRKTYLRHGAKEPLFGVKFATLKDLLKRIGVDHELACALWDTGNFDARNLAVKVADPACMSEADLDHWARGGSASMCLAYVAALANEGPHASSRAQAWLASKNDMDRANGWSLVGARAMRDLSASDAWFLARIGEIETSIHAAPNLERGMMNQALVSIGCRNAVLRKAASAAAKRIGPVAVDHGDTACETPAVVAHLDKAWAHSKAKGHESPAAQEQTRESMRLRC